MKTIFLALLMVTATLNSVVTAQTDPTGVSVSSVVSQSVQSVVSQPVSESVIQIAATRPVAVCAVPHPQRYGRGFNQSRPETLAPMLTRAPIIASPVTAASMILSVGQPERYNYRPHVGYSPARGGFIFNRRRLRR